MALDRPQGLRQISKGPPDEPYRFVLRRTSKVTKWVMRAWRRRFYDGTSVARDVVHPDGERVPTHFVNKKQHRDILWREGWEDVSAEWFAALEAGNFTGHPELKLIEDAPEIPPKAGPIAPAEMERIEKLTLKQLQGLAGKLDLPTNGKKADLRLRIFKHLSE